MSFLFKSSKKGAPEPRPANANAPSLHATRDTIARDGAGASGIPTLNGVANGAKPGSPTPAQSINGSLNSLSDKASFPARPADERVMAVREEGARPPGPPSPEQKSLREARDGSRDAQHRLPMQPRLSHDQASSPYPWSQRRLNFTLTHANPFPRYGAAVNASASKDGSIYLMGGLINGSTVKGDLWMVDAGAQAAGSMACFPVATTSEGPGPRVGHASLLVGNAFIVFGGDTKMDEGDMLDDTLYLLNTSTKQWSRALPAGPRPPGRYGHTLNILGSKIYIFGGQVEGYFFNDLVAFDLNALQQATNRWEILVQNTIDGGPPHGQIPPARTNHTIIAWQDRLYLFGGTDGMNWYNDVWSYSPASNSWVQLDCVGYIPSPREGHAAALVGDVMYIFGGRNEEGNDLGDLAAFRISSRRWYTFQNMGPSPSPRSGHSMTTVGKQIVVLAGEPSSAPRDPVELGLAYFLDTSKIRYPPDSTPTPPNERVPAAARRPSNDRAGSQGRGPSRAELLDREHGDRSRIRSPDGASRLPRAQGQLPAPAGPPPQAPAQRQPGPQPTSRQPTRTPDRAFSPSNENERPQIMDHVMSVESHRNLPVQRDRGMPMSPSFEEDPEPYAQQQTAKPETYQPSQQQAYELQGRSSSPNESRTDSRQQHARPEGTPRPSVDSGPMSKMRQMSKDPEVPQDSGVGSSPASHRQHDDLAREVELLRQKNAWYASELLLAKKSGYQSRSTESPVFDERVHDAFKDDDKPLIEALLKMRADLSKVQERIDEQSKNTAERIGEVEKQRDVAINEAVFAKAKLAGHGSPQSDGETKGSDRGNDMSRRLASSLEAQSELSRRLGKLVQEVEAEKKARALAEDTAEAAQKRAAELDTYRQQHTSEIETLRSQLHEAQKAHREIAARHAEISAQHKILSVDKQELSRKLDALAADERDHTATLVSLREAVTASSDKAELLERKLEEERNTRDQLERSLRELKTQHEQRTTELESAARRLQDAEELVEKHAAEARTHREAVLAGFGKVSERDLGDNSAHDERVAVLQEQVEAATAMVRQNQAAADSAAEKLRRAEERIAGLESYQEQASREGLSIRKQLQMALKENQALNAEKADLEQKLERHMLETNALSVQHASLKDILNERGINPAEKRRSRAADSPSMQRFSTPDLHRVRDLEQQLESNAKAHEELKAQFEEINLRSEQTKREYEEKLAAIDNDHQAAVKYLRGTEKMLSKMKQEMQRVKNENGDLKKQLDKAKDDMESSRSSPATRGADELEAEREKMRQEISKQHAGLQSTVAEMEGRITKMQEQLQTTQSELTCAQSSHAAARSDLSTLHTTFASSRTDIERLQKENALLEERAKNAEDKVQLLLDQVESSVDNYRRQSRMRDPGETPTLNGSVLQRPPSISEASDATGGSDHLTTTHSRNMSHSGEGTYSPGARDSAGDSAGRNSMALDSLASELDALRTHWETTNKTYRLSDRFEYDGGTLTSAPAPGTSSMADWRRALELEDDDDHTRPATRDGRREDAAAPPTTASPTTSHPVLRAGGMLS